MFLCMLVHSLLEQVFVHPNRTKYRLSQQMRWNGNPHVLLSWVPETTIWIIIRAAYVCGAFCLHEYIMCMLVSGLVKPPKTFPTNSTNIYLKLLTPYKVLFIFYLFLANLTIRDMFMKMLIGCLRNSYSNYI